MADSVVLIKELFDLGLHCMIRLARLIFRIYMVQITQASMEYSISITFYESSVANKIKLKTNNFTSYSNEQIH